MIDKKVYIVAYIILIIACSFFALQAHHWRDTAQLRSDTADAWCDKYEEEVAKVDSDPTTTTDKAPVPQWFAKELNDTITHSGIRVQFGLSGEEEDVVIMSGKALDRLERLAEPKNKSDNDYYYTMNHYWEYMKTYNPDTIGDAE